MPVTNPLLRPWNTPFGLPPYGDLHDEHFLPAIEEAMAEHRAEIAAIVANPAPASFENTIQAIDRSGLLLQKIALLFGNLSGSATSPSIQAIELTLNPKLAAHQTAIALDAGLFARIEAVYADRHQLGLDAESLRLTERVHLDFVLSGARLAGPQRERYAAIVEQLAGLTARFAQNVLADEAAFVLHLERESDLAGLPADLRAAAAAAAKDRGLEGWVITLSRSLVSPFLSFSSRRDLRQRAYEAWLARGEHEGEHDNRPLIREILTLRQEQAQLHGYPTYADFILVDTMAGTPDAARALLERVWTPARSRALEELEALRSLAAELGEPTDIQPWDWRYLAEKLRQRRYELDDAEIKPYFSLEGVRAAIFDCAARLFGIEMRERADLPAYHPDVRSFEVHRNGQLIGIFQADDFARPTKQGGAWMSELRGQARIDGERVLPLVLNNNNFNRGEPTLLSFDDVRTMFHEFGHGLHGLLSDVGPARLAGTNVLRDFVELPSQIMENWALEPEVLRRHARHVDTGAPIPDALIERIRAAGNFNKGFETVEYLSCALLDLTLHQTDPAGLDPTAFEARELARIGMPAEIRMRHRLPHFGHLFAGDGYSSRYYVYMWAEVLDADGFQAFKEAGRLFDADTARRLLRHIFSAGNSVPPAEAYRAFRGRDPVVEPLLRARGLLPAEA